MPRSVRGATDRPGCALPTSATIIAEPCAEHGVAITPSAPMEALEPGLFTLFKIVGTLVLSMGIIPLVFLMVEGDRSEPRGFIDKK